MLKSLSVTSEEKEFIQTILLPKIEKSIGENILPEESAERASIEKTPEIPLQMGQEKQIQQQAAQNIIQTLYDSLPASKEEIQTVLKEILEPGHFPVIVPYPTSFSPMRRLSKRRRRRHEERRDKDEEKAN